MPLESVQSEVFLMVVAGTDTVATTVINILIQLRQNQDVRKKLTEEVRNLALSEDLSYLISDEFFQACKACKYLNNCLMESLRLDPAAPNLFPRLVPHGGMYLCNQFIPGGTEITCPSWVLHRNEDVFGSDPEKFKPERWDGPHKMMNEMLATFGSGSRRCLGQVMARTEVIKMIGIILVRYEHVLEYVETYTLGGIRVNKNCKFYLSRRKS